MGRIRANAVPRLLTSLCLLTSSAFAQDPGVVLTGAASTEHCELRFRPGSRAEASVDRVMALVEDDLRRIQKELGVAPLGTRIRLWLYDDVAELQRLTGVPSAGHSTPLQSHVPHDNDQTRVHELVHVVAERFPEKGPEARNLFFAEGLANAVLRFVHGVHVDAVAAFHLQRGELPKLAELHAVPDFYAWMQRHPTLQAYDVAGSYMRYLLDTYGAEKVRRYYCGVPAKVAFGVELAALEQGWHKRLGKVELRPGTTMVLTERVGGGGGGSGGGATGRLTAEELGPPSEWTDLTGNPLGSGEPGSWQGRELVLDGAPSQGDWCVVRVSAEDVGDAMVRCRIEPQPGCFGVQLQLGNGCQGMVLRDQGAFVYRGGECTGAVRGIGLGDQPVELVLRRRGAQLEVWVDGQRALAGEVDGKGARVGVGCVGGKAKVSAIAVRRLP